MELAEPNMSIKPEDTETTRWLWNALAESGPQWVEVSLEEIEEGDRLAEEIMKNNPANQMPIIPEEIPSDTIS